MALRLRGSTSGYAEIDAPAVAGDVTLTLPSTTGTINVKDASGNTEVGTGVTFGNPGANIFTVNNTGGERLRIAADGTVSIPGALNVSGVLTYEDVTSVDAIGLSTFRDGLNTKDVGITTISTSVSDTAVDVFIYDTSKDSDGGEWRKRTSHTSWYNETLNTATRGSRKEFPAVAVIVAEATKVTIYDGDDPDLPMWMIVTGSNNDYAIETEATSIFALNGVLSIGCGGSGFDLYLVKFLEDAAYEYSTGGYRKFVDNIATRSSSTRVSVDLTLQIIDRKINDVAMTVLPNAPIDDATGLPVPTIAVGTDGGVSVIKDDGTVANISRGGNSEYTGSIAFDEDNHIVITWGTSDGGYRHISRITDINTTTTNGDGYTNDYFTAYIEGAGNSVAGDVNGAAKVDNIGRNFAVNYDNTTVRADNPDDRLVRVVPFSDANGTAQNLVSFATTSYNTGWMHGDIKGAFLSDTSTTNVTAGSDLVTNGSFTTDSDWEKSGHWTISGGSATMPSTSSYYPLYTQANVFEVGKVYVVTVVVSAISGTLKLGSANTSSGGGIQSDEWQISSTGTYSAIIKSNASDDTRFGIARLESGTASCTIDSVTIFEAAELDRSVNGNGLQVFGTITKTAVATGAELVAYSGWNDAVNNLYQPYNSDLDFGTNDFSIMLWAKHPIDASASAHGTYISHTQNGTPPSNGDWIIRTEGSSGYLTFYIRSGGTWYTTRYETSVPASTWYHLAAVRRSGIMYLYIDGKQVASGGLNYAVNSTNGIRIGVRYGDTNNYSNEDMKGSMSLLRISASAPSPEQIKKIYEDEKVLFQENAACTLYGSSDVVTALAYDEITDRLHVGTSSGRSDFQGLRRINNTTTAVTTAISAHDSFIIEQ